MAEDIAESVTSETLDKDLIDRAGIILRDNLDAGERERLLAILMHALWSASFRPVLTSYVLERLALPLSNASGPAKPEPPAG